MLIGTPCPCLSRIWGFNGVLGLPRADSERILTCSFHYLTRIEAALTEYCKSPAVAKGCVNLFSEGHLKSEYAVYFRRYSHLSQHFQKAVAKHFGGEAFPVLMNEYKPHNPFTSSSCSIPLRNFAYPAWFIQRVCAFRLFLLYDKNSTLRDII